MLQVCVLNINEAFNTISKLTHFDIRYEGIKQEPWGKVIYLWGPSGELLHITELNKLKKMPPISSWWHYLIVNLVFH